MKHSNITVVWKTIACLVRKNILHQMRFLNGFEQRYTVGNEEYECPDPDIKYPRM